MPTLQARAAAPPTPDPSTEQHSDLISERLFANTKGKKPSWRGQRRRNAAGTRCTLTILASECTGRPDGETEPLLLMGGPGMPGMLGTMDTGRAS